MKRNTEEDFIQIQDLWKMSVEKWHWFAISLTICLIFAFLYIAITSPVYTRMAAVLIKDNSAKGGMLSDNINTFSDMGLFKSNTNINNEILTFKSPLLMQEVVQRMKLDEDYSTKGFFRNKPLYKNSPVIVSIDSTNVNESFSFYIELLPQNKIRLANLTLNGEELDFPDEEINLSESVNTPLGSIRINPTAFYSKVYYNQQILFVKSNLRSIVNHYTNALNVGLSNEDATIIDISLNDVSAQRAEDILDTLITVYNKNWIQERTQIAVNTSSFIEERLNVIEKELGGVEDSISRFKSQNLIPDIQAASNMYMARSNENDTKIQALSTQHTIAKYILSHLKDSRTKDMLLPANLGIEGTNIDRQINEYNTLLLKRNTLLANSSDNNPLVLDIKQSLLFVREAIISSVDNLLISLDTQIRNIQKSETKINERIASSPEQAKYLLSVERQQAVKEALYLFLLQKQEENQLSQTFTVYNTKIITPPSGNMFPTTPRKTSILLVAAAIGFLLPAIIIIIVENMTITLRGRKDLSSLSLPFIGEIPQIINGKKKLLLKNRSTKNRDDIIVKEGKKDYMNEAFRVIRTNLDFILSTNGEAQQKVIMFTSFNIGSGKTFTTINLAISMAIKGKKVVVIDLDMRKASLSSYIDSPSAGISNYLGKMIDNPDQIIRKGAIHPNLDIIPAGTIPPNPVELLLDDRLQQLLDELREKYDYIFLDCPPVEIVTDASIVGKVTDITIFVVRAGLMDRRMLPEIEEMYQKDQYNNMTLLLNGTQYMRGKYGYNRYGYTHADNYLA
ncbi:polysaccharide biosynthesis tyrosine autokinase [uncultured Dysgonomonas sp.]|uniref:non-specific protein-tyrosine kinase n=1 Tax=uncultured Dysgonomonas sp. TaxID=206096 RepID=A0A212K7W5_9BACT|nr:polysaccharide biosynthesis tyrosine autokinase [uncultured Dysgonomonas sp.]SBW07595.1 conserved hypothetical protein [uncultured Dysgonomonas sp.]